MKYLIFLTLLVPNLASAAIAFGVASSPDPSLGATGGNGSAMTLTGTNVLLLCMIESVNALTTRTVTFNGASLTEIGTVINDVDTNNYLYGLLGPTTGSSIAPVFSWDSSAGFHRVSCVSYTGVSQTALPSNIHTNTSGARSTDTSLTETIAVDSTANSWIVLNGRNEGGSFTAGTGSTERQTDGDSQWYDSGTTVTPSANYSMTLTFPAGRWTIKQIQLNPAVASTFQFWPFNLF